MTKLVPCPIEGCTFRGSRRAVRRHADQPHVRCTCGWAGIEFNRHRGVKIRFAIEAAGRDGADEVAVGNDERRRHRRLDT